MFPNNMEVHGMVTLLLVGCFGCLLGLGSCLNYRPIIGIVSEEVSSGKSSYIAASYVKYVESAGAQVVPIFSNTSQDDLKSLFDSINGILFPGGGVSVVSSGYAAIGRAVVQMAMDAVDAGDYFPVWGTCLGFELLTTMVGGEGILSQVDAGNYSIPLNLTSAAQTSRLFSLFSSSALGWISQEPLTTNNHYFAVTTDTFKNNPKLTEFFTVLSTNLDKNGVEFVSTMESKKYPVYGVQWHPEKNGFEWESSQATNHSEHAVAVMQYTANFLIQEARKSSHKFVSSEAEQKALIYNYSPLFTPGTHYTQVYVF
jgi:gamma-glutamyl hydrolase